ncbi:hypothetical protein FOZ62_024087, partial [Perkinsus olseni]
FNPEPSSADVKEVLELVREHSRFPVIGLERQLVELMQRQRLARKSDEKQQNRYGSLTRRSGTSLAESRMYVGKQSAPSVASTKPSTFGSIGAEPSPEGGGNAGLESSSDGLWNFRGRLGEKLQQALGRNPDASELSFSYDALDGGTGFMCTVSVFGIDFRSDPCSKKKQADQDACRSALESWDTLIEDTLALQVAAGQQAGPDASVCRMDAKSRLNHALQRKLGRPVTRVDVTYHTEQMKDKENLFRSILRLGCMPGDRTFDGIGALSKGSAEQDAAARALEWLNSLPVTGPS